MTCLDRVGRCVCVCVCVVCVTAWNKYARFSEDFKGKTLGVRK